MSVLPLSSGERDEVANFVRQVPYPRSGHQTTQKSRSNEN